MAEFRVRWEIQVDAEDAESAAVFAWESLRDPSSLATTVDVFDEHGGHEAYDMGDESGSTVTCGRCAGAALRANARMREGKWIGDGCWDPRREGLGA